MDVSPFLMLLVLIAFLISGYPVAFVLPGIALTFGIIGFGPDFFTLLPMRIWGRMTNQTLVAVPLFVFMGVMLERSRVAEELLETMGMVMGRLRGGLAVSVVIVGALLAASTGIAGATVATMGIISLPVMLKRGYKPELATGAITSSGTLGQIIPPSIVLVILADIMGVSVGELFMGGMVPGLVLVTGYLVYILLYAFLKPEVAPGLTHEETLDIRKHGLAGRVVRVLIPPLVLIVAVLGSIFFGIASPTEAAAVGAFGALVLAVVKRRFSFRILHEVTMTTTRLCSMVFMILVGAAAFGLVFRGLGGDVAVKDFLLGLGGGRWGVMAIIMCTLFLLGFFLDFIEITFIVVPILVPIIEHLQFNPLWFAILIALNFQTSFLTPPFGFALFFLRGVSPAGVTTGHIYRGVVPFVVVQLLILAMVMIWPSLALWLPGVLYD